MPTSTRIAALWLIASLMCLAGVSAAQTEVTAHPDGREIGNCTARDSSTRPDCPRAIAFLHDVQSAVRTNQPEKVASLVSFPLRGVGKLARTKADFIRNYDAIFNASVRCAILHADDSEVWGNYRGFTIERGTIWWDGIIPPHARVDVHSPDYWTKYPFKILTVNRESALLIKDCKPQSQHKSK